VSLRVQFALCAQSVSIDRASNRLTIINVIDHWPASIIPIVLPSIAFVCILESDQDESVSYTGTLAITNNDNSILNANVPITFTNGRLARVVLNVNSIPIRQYGTLSLTLTIPDQAKAEVKFKVISAAPKVPEATPASPPPAAIK
jgi:hypothetical protein